jgi:hypothetical protein
MTEGLDQQPNPVFPICHREEIWTLILNTFGGVPYLYQPLRRSESLSCQKHSRFFQEAWTSPSILQKSMWNKRVRRLT